MALVIGWEEKPATTARRSAFEVRMDILKVVSVGSARPTRIMYKSNTSWLILQRNLAALAAAGFIRGSGDGHKVEYAITDRGTTVLRDYINIVSRTIAAPSEVWA